MINFQIIILFISTNMYNHIRAKCANVILKLSHFTRAEQCALVRENNNCDRIFDKQTLKYWNLSLTVKPVHHAKNKFRNRKERIK